MDITGISTNVDALLKGMNNPDPVFKTVLAGPPDSQEDFAGFPAVCHYYDDGEGNYATVSQNRRVYIYIVEIYYVGNSDTPSLELLAEIYPTIDATLNMFDHSIDLSSTELGLSRACDIMRPAPGKLDRITTKDGKGYMLTIRLYCEADISFRDS